jgi:hypothetical protein
MSVEWFGEGVQETGNRGFGPFACRWQSEDLGGSSLIEILARRVDGKNEVSRRPHVDMANAKNPVVGSDPLGRVLKDRTFASMATSRSASQQVTDQKQTWGSGDAEEKRLLSFVVVSGSASRSP